jgi:hypothetical protein
MTIEGLSKETAIRNTVKAGIAAKAWRNTVESDACAWLTKTEKTRKAEVLAFVRAEFDAAGCSVNGRWS